MKLVYCDLIAYEGLHTGVNSALIKVMNLTFQPDIIEFYAEKNHLDICKKKNVEKNIVYKNLQLLPKSMVGGLKTILKDIIGCLYIFKIFLTTKKDDVICIALAYPFAQFSVFIFNKIFKRANVFVCQHGELELLFNKKAYPIFKRYYFSIEEILLCKKSKIRNIIFGETIFNNVKVKFPNINAIVIDHPYVYDYVNSKDVHVEFNPLIIGVIGNTGVNKGTEYVFQLADLLRDYILEGKLMVKIVGKLADVYKDYDKGLVIHQHTGIIPEEIFQSEIESLHYALLLRNNEMNKLTASGTFFDIVKYQKPYLSFQGEYISHYYNKNPNAGELFDDIYQLADRIKNIIENKSQSILDYKKSIEAILDLQNDLSLTSIANKFSQQV
jgi:hypothetical protein